MDALVGGAAVVNTGGADLILGPGVATSYFTVVDYSLGGTETVTITIDGTPTVLTATSGSPGANEFKWETSNDVTASNLAAAIDAIPGVASSSTLAEVFIDLDLERYLVALAASNPSFCAATQGADGDVIVPITPTVPTAAASKGYVDARPSKGSAAYAGAAPIYSEANGLLPAVGDFGYFLKGATDTVFHLFRRSVSAGTLVDFGIVEMT